MDIRKPKGVASALPDLWKGILLFFKTPPCHKSKWHKGQEIELKVKTGTEMENDAKVKIDMGSTLESRARLKSEGEAVLGLQSKTEPKSRSESE
ncbi:hypothetical protein EVAR_30099_1 [Eumeta japonica]|uniref:Uncharacterized protein n=1 Tax=Eumeta variegata TaxID=151549 RepID=A0A4C1WIR5_EUMVA|nr:hypothetical protein EVAR_30099_1 [Eumeta japonica]